MFKLLKNKMEKPYKLLAKELEHCVSNNHLRFSLCGFYFQLASSAGSSSKEPSKT